MQKLDFSLISDNSFNTIDGRELKIKDYFVEKDFVLDDRGSIFVKHAGLLRTAKKVFEIKEYKATVIQAPMDNNLLCSTVEVTYGVCNKISKDSNTSQSHHSWTSAADCHRLNSMEGFDKYTTTIAETRASARALRNLLGIEFCSKEEIAGDIVGADSDSLIQQHQKDLLERKFMGEMKVTIEEISKIINKPINTIEELSFSQAALVLQKLNSSRAKKKE